jgi:hypothetical protein
VGCTNGAGVAAPFATSFADPNCPGAIQLTAAASLTDRLGLTRTHRTHIRSVTKKGEPVGEGSYLILGKWARVRRFGVSMSPATDRSDWIVANVITNEKRMR